MAWITEARSENIRSTNPRIVTSTGLLILTTVCSWAIPVAYSKVSTRTARNAASTQAPRPREIAKRAMPSVVSLRAVDQDGGTVASGTGFYVRAGLIATCYHVIKGGYAVRASPVTGGPEYTVSAT